MANAKHGSVQGVADVLKVLEGLKLSIANKIARPALSKAASRGAKIVKAKIPSRYKSVRAAIGWRPGKAKNNNGMASAKVGAGVGQNKKDGGGKRSIRKATSTKDRTGRKGVGIDGRNVHWWFMGTENRMTKAGRFTGRMPAQEEPITVILSQHAGELTGIVRTWVQSGIEKEVTRTAKK